jgi:hypothetical protein
MTALSCWPLFTKSMFQFIQYMTVSLDTFKKLQVAVPLRYDRLDVFHKIQVAVLSASECSKSQ